MSPMAETLERARGALDGMEFHELESGDGIATIRVSMENAYEIMRALRDAAGFEISTLITAVDHADASYPVDGRFDLVWQFQSIQHKDRIRVLAWVAGEEVGEETFSAPTITDLWPGAAYSERECYDMFGITFNGHENLRRILMPDAYEHHPLRKEFPHGGIEPDKLYKAWDKKRREPAGEPS